MINKLNNDNLYNILEFLYNHEVMDFIFINKKIYNQIDKKYILDFMSYRDHPLVFNSLDRYCLLCNQGIVFMSDTNDIDIINCNHN